MGNEDATSKEIQDAWEKFHSIKEKLDVLRNETVDYKAINDNISDLLEKADLLERLYKDSEQERELSACHQALVDVYNEYSHLFVDNPEGASIQREQFDNLARWILTKKITSVSIIQRELEKSTLLSGPSSSAEDRLMKENIDILQSLYVIYNPFYGIMSEEQSDVQFDELAEFEMQLDGLYSALKSVNRVPDEWTDDWSWDEDSYDPESESDSESDMLNADEDPDIDTIPRPSVDTQIVTPNVGHDDVNQLFNTVANKLFTVINSQQQVDLLDFKGKNQEIIHQAKKVNRSLTELRFAIGDEVELSNNLKKTLTTIQRDPAGISDLSHKDLQSLHKKIEQEIKAVKKQKKIANKENKSPEKGIKQKLRSKLSQISGKKSKNANKKQAAPTSTPKR